MKIWKRFVALTMTLAFCFLLGSMPAYAASENLTGSPIFLEPVNEALYILQQQKKSNEALVQSGWSTDAIKELRSVSLEEHFLGLKEQSYDQLKADGFTTEQIRLIYAYDGEPITENSAVLAAGATCTGSFDFYQCGYYKYEVSYHWEWTTKPILNEKDTVAVVWKAYNTDSIEMDCDCTYKQGQLFYRYSGVNTTAYAPTFTASSMPLTEASGCKYTYSASYATNYNGTPNTAWVKEGFLSIKLENSSNQMSYIKMGAALGHMTIAITANPRINANTGALSWSITFEPTVTYNTTASVMEKATHSGVVTDIS